jgi:ureidoacrylate peracid hydrolase
MHTIRYPDWLGQGEKWGGPFDVLEPAQTALVVVDLQRFFLRADGMDIATAREIVPRVNELAAATRAIGGTVVFLRHTFVATGPGAMPSWQFTSRDRREMLAAGLSEGAPGHALDADLDVAPQDTVLNKYRPSAFLPTSSNLDSMLRARGIDTLIITGCVTNVCCESTARDAQMMDYRVIFVADATASQNDDLHNAALLNLQYYFADVVAAAEVMQRLMRARDPGRDAPVPVVESGG